MWQMGLRCLYLAMNAITRKPNTHPIKRQDKDAMKQATVNEIIEDNHEMTNLKQRKLKKQQVLNLTLLY